MSGGDAERALVVWAATLFDEGVEWLPVGTHRSGAGGAAPPPRSHPDRAPGPPSPPRRGGRRAALRVAPLREQVGPPERRAALAAIGAEIRACERCPLARGRTLAVPGEGAADADLMFVGEGPGRDEDHSGRPFVGRAGELLSRIVEAIGFTRESVFITNVVKCRPPNNRTPTPQETGACFPFLERQVEVIDPKVVCTLGLPATRQLLPISGGISKVRGRVFEWRGRALVPTFHPAFLLRQPDRKGDVWKDMQTVVRVLEERGGRVPDRRRFEENLRRSGEG